VEIFAKELITYDIAKDRSQKLLMRHGEECTPEQITSQQAAHAALNPDLLQNNPVSGRGCSA